jgi:hypothetical protein
MMVRENLRTSCKENRKYITGFHEHRHGTESPAFDAAKGWTEVGSPEAIAPAGDDRRWSKNEDDQLLEMIDAGTPINVMCTDLKRTADAIRLRALVLRHSAAYRW